MTLSGRRGIDYDPAATTISATIALPIVGAAASATIALRYLDGTDMLRQRRHFRF